MESPEMTEKLEEVVGEDQSVLAKKAAPFLE